MEIRRVQDYDELSHAASMIVREKVCQNPQLVLGLATGDTPMGMYRHLVNMNSRKAVSFRRVHSFNLDEYVGMVHDHLNSYHYYMNQHFFSLTDIQSFNTHVPNGLAEDLSQECIDYENRIRMAGGINLQILGIGSNGHIGFNEPGTSFSSKTSVVNLTSSTLKANARFFENEEQVPTQAITMGIATIMESREILLLVSGEQKRYAIEQLLTGDITECFPASILKLHPAVTLLVDESAWYESR